MRACLLPAFAILTGCFTLPQPVEPPPPPRPLVAYALWGQITDFNPITDVPYATHQIEIWRDQREKDPTDPALFTCRAAAAVDARFALLIDGKEVEERTGGDCLRVGPEGVGDKIARGIEEAMWTKGESERPQDDGDHTECKEWAPETYHASVHGDVKLIDVTDCAVIGSWVVSGTHDLHVVLAWADALAPVRSVLEQLAPPAAR